MIFDREHVQAPNGWRISMIKMTRSFQDGNPKLLEKSLRSRRTHEHN